MWNWLTWLGKWGGGVGLYMFDGEGDYVCEGLEDGGFVQNKIF